MNTLVVAAIRCFLIFLLPAGAYAISAQWDLDPISGDWNTAANWTPMGVPNGPADIATFGLSNTTNISISANTEVNSIIFTPAATNPYTITTGSGSLTGFTLTISGAGIINSSGIVQHFVTNGGQFGQISFTNNATAGSFTIFTNNHGVNNFVGGHTFFFDTSTAGNATFINNNGTPSGEFFGFMSFFESSTASKATIINNGSTMSHFGNGGGTGFSDTASAGQATITNNGAAAIDAVGGITSFSYSSTAASATIINNAGLVSGAMGGGSTFFTENATAANATVTNNGGMVSGAGGGQTFFRDHATADSATLIANGGTAGGQGGTIRFEEQSTGGTSRIEVFGNGNLDISFMSFPHHSDRGVTVGSIEGDGDIFVGEKNLTVGSNDFNTTFSGEIQDGGQNGGTGGSLTKIGTGTLILSGTNTYTGDTNIKNRGVLQVDGSINSDTTVHINGTLAGRGTIHGNVTNNSWGKVSPGEMTGVPGVLTVVHNYTQAQYARLMIQIAGANVGEFSVLNVLETANLSGYLKPILLNGFVPTIDQSFTFLNYGAVNGTLSIFNPNIANEDEHWEVSYFPTYAILTVVPGNVAVPDQGSTFVLLTLGLLGLVTFRRQLLREGP